MVRLTPASGSVATESMTKILQSLSNDDLRLPSRVLIDEPGEDWKPHAAALSAEERRRVVIAASSEESLIDAARFEIGGAVWLPASTPSVEAACESAASRHRHPCAPIATRGILECLVSETSELWAVGWWPRSFWHRQLGWHRLTTCLTAIATRLGCVPAILPDPILVVAGRGREAIEEACRDGSAVGGGAVPVLPAVVRVVAQRPGIVDGRVDGLLANMAKEAREAEHGPGEALPVLEIFTGEKIGSWSFAHDAGSGGRGWRAIPSGQILDGRCWDIVAEDGSRTRVEEIEREYGPENEGYAVLRIPGFLGAQLRRGSPAGLLVERWATHEARAGRPLWVPSVDEEGVRFLLGLPGPIWVDGPGVPR